MPGKDLRLLCLDGGGVRGLSSLQILKQILLEINPAAPPKPCEYFDMIGGTSTGGLQAIMLGRLELSVDRCIEAYTSVADRVFVKKRQLLSWSGKLQARYDSEILTQVIQEIIVSAGLHRDELLWDKRQGSCKTFVCATSQETSGIVPLTSYQSLRSRTDLLKKTSIWEAARATTAASSFFDPISIGDHKTTFLDGGTGANNPIYELWMQAKDVFCASEDLLEDRITCLISIGTGVPGPKTFGNYPTTIAKALLAISTETEDTARRFARDRSRLSEEGRYFRFNVPSGLHNIPMEDAKRKNEIVAVTDRYLEDQETFMKVQACGKLLSSSTCTVTDSKPRGPSNAEMIKNLPWGFINDIIKISIRQETAANEGLQLRDTNHDSTFFFLSPEYVSFVESRTAAILWHPGPPGSGKSSILRHLVKMTRNTRDDRHVTAYFHLRSDAVRALVTPSDVFRRLLGQIVYQVTSYGPDANLSSEYFRTGSASQRLPLPENLAKMMSEMASEWRSVFCTGTELLPAGSNKISMELMLNVLRIINIPNTLIAIDDIDRMAPFPRQSLLILLLEMFESLKLSGIPVKILIVSRPYNDIRQCLAEVPMLDQDTEYRHCVNSLYFEGMHARRDQVSFAQPLTYQWIWDHPQYKDWYSCEGQDKSSILWIQGKAGSGKSTLAKMIQSTLQPALKVNPELRSDEMSQLGIFDSSNVPLPDNSSASKDIVADFFFSGRDGEKERSPKWMMQSLLYQIMEQRQSLFPIVQSTYRGVVQDSHGNWTYDSLKSAFLALAVNSARRQQDVHVLPRIYLIVDAADESQGVGKIERTDMLALFYKLCSYSVSAGSSCIFKILLISRPASDIERELRRVHSIELHNQTQRDIEMIVEAGMTSIMMSLQAPDDSGSEGEDEQLRRSVDNDVYQQQNLYKNQADFNLIRHHLIENANGVLLWVVLIIQELKKMFGGGFWTVAEIKEMLTSLPEDLEHCYLEMIQKILESAEKDIKRRHTTLDRRITKTTLMLMWTTFTQRALTVEEFREVIALVDLSAWESEPPQSFSSTLSATLLIESRLAEGRQIRRALMYFCNGFLEITDGSTMGFRPQYIKSRTVKPTDFVQVLHRSAKDFLVSNVQASPFFLRSDEGSTKIAEMALKYLRLSLPATGLPSVSTTWSETDYEAFIFHLNDRPLLAYILSSLSKHIQRSNASTNLQLQLQGYLAQIQGSGYAWSFLAEWSSRENYLSMANSTPMDEAFREKCINTAAKLQKSQVLRLIMEAGVGDLSKALMAAALQGDLTSVKTILNRTTKGQYLDCNSPFFASADAGHVEIVRLFLVTGRVQPDTRTESEESALHLAAVKGHSRIVDLLLKAGADIEANNSRGMTPLQGVSLEGKLDVVQLLIEQGASITPQTRFLPLSFLPISRDSLGSLQTDCGRYGNWTPLTLAVVKKHLEVAQFLLGKAAEMDAMDASGNTRTFWDNEQSQGHLAMRLAKQNDDNKMIDILSSFKAISDRWYATRFERMTAAGPGAQNRHIESLLGKTKNTRDSLHLLSLVDDFKDELRGSKRFSTIYK